MSDIVKNLRQGKAGYQSYSAFVAVTPTHLEAANEIERLQAENARLQESLGQLIYEVTHLSPQEDDGSHWCRITGQTLKKARAALGETNNAKV